MEKEGKFRVEKLNSQNDQLWKMKMEDYLYQKDLYLLLGGKEKQSTTMKDEEWEVLDRKALRTIRLCLASLVAFNISKEKTAEGVMSAFFPYKRKHCNSCVLYFNIVNNICDYVRETMRE